MAGGTTLNQSWDKWAQRGLASALVLLSGLIGGCGRGAPDPERVLIVVNADSPVSLAIGEYYRVARELGEDQVLQLSVPVVSPSLADPADETITREAFVEHVRDPVAHWLEERDRVDDVHFIVIAKGVPLRIQGSRGPVATVLRDETGASVDAELAVLFSDLEGSAGVTGSANPYFASKLSFSDFREENPDAPLRYLVARLTGYQEPLDVESGVPEDVKHLIDAAQAQTSPDDGAGTDAGVWLIDQDPSLAVGRREANAVLLESAATALRALGQEEFLESTALFAFGWKDIRGYASWGSNDRHDPGPPFYGNIDGEVFPGDFAPRALAVDFVSTNARTFTAPAHYGQSLVADLVRAGVAGATGHVYEPTLSGVPRPHILLSHYASGVPVGEAYYRSIPYLGWQNVYVGDPLMTVAEPADDDVSDLDGDGIDDDMDNCLGLANPEQRDSDEDGYGNACDADVDGDGLVTTSWGQTYPLEARGDLEWIALSMTSGVYDPNHDLNGDGRVDASDVALASIPLFLPPGPSATVH